MLFAFDSIPCCLVEVSNQRNIWMSYLSPNFFFGFFLLDSSSFLFIGVCARRDRARKRVQWLGLLMLFRAVVESWFLCFSFSEIFCSLAYRKDKKQHSIAANANKLSDHTKMKLNKNLSLVQPHALHHIYFVCSLAQQHHTPCARVLLQREREEEEHQKTLKHKIYLLQADESVRSEAAASGENASENKGGGEMR